MSRKALRALMLTLTSAAIATAAFAPGCSCGDKPSERRAASGDPAKQGKRVRAERTDPPAERRVLPEGTLAAVEGDVTLDARDRRPPPMVTAQPEGSGTPAREDEREPEGDDEDTDGERDTPASAPGEAPGQRSVAREGDELYIGDAVITGEGASATVRTTDGAEVYLGPGSMLVIEPHGAGQILLPRGRARVYLPPTGPRRRPVNVVTMAGIASVASGDLLVAARADGAVRLEVLAGSVSVDLAAGPVVEPASLAREPAQVTAGKRLDLLAPPPGRDPASPTSVDGASGLDEAVTAADAWLATVGASPSPMERSRALLERAVSEANALFVGIERRREQTVQLHEQHRQAIASKRGQTEAQGRIIENARALFKLNAAGRAAWGRVRAALLMAEDGTRSSFDGGGAGTPYTELSSRAGDVFRRTHRAPPGRRGNFPQLPVKIDPSKIRIPGPRVPLSDQSETRPR